ncbi:MAG: MazG family protein [Cyanobacteria bacterium P01_G01_bin.4]
MNICDLRGDIDWATLKFHLSHQFGHRPLLLTHCTLQVWERVSQLLQDALQHDDVPPNVSPADFQMAIVGVSECEPGEFLPVFELLSVEEVATRFRTQSVLHAIVPALYPQSVSAVGRLMDIVATLRSPNGCPWDRAQTPLSLTPYIVEEAYEAVAAIRSHDIDHTVEELGDLLLQVVLQSQVFSESGDFTLADVADGISTKLIRRHPHVFGPDATGGNTDIVDVKQRWDEIKQEEKAAETLHDKLVSYATTFPPLLAATKIAKKTASTADGRKNSAELLQTASDHMSILQDLVASDGSPVSNEDVQEQLGQLMFSLVQLGLSHGVKMTDALDRANWAAIRDASETTTSWEPSQRQ